MTQQWTVRVRTAGRNEVAVTGGRFSFPVGAQLAFEASGSTPTALEVFLGAFGADLVAGFRAAVARRRLPEPSLEFRGACVLDNPLTFLGVVGETGHPGVKEITGTLYVDVSRLAAGGSENGAKATAHAAAVGGVGAPIDGASTRAAIPLLTELWAEVLERSPLYCTLRPVVTLTLQCAAV